MCNSVILSCFTKGCGHDHNTGLEYFNTVLEYFHHPSKILHAHLQIISVLSPR